MKHQLAQLNVARFKLPREHPDNADFISNLDRVNAVAEAQPGFVWRLVGEGNDALDIQAFDDPFVVVNISVWRDLEALGAFVYRNKDHLAIMRRRKEWFDKIEFHLVLWWIADGHIPSLNEAKEKLGMLTSRGPTKNAFTFKQAFSTPTGAGVQPFSNECEKTTQISDCNQ